MRLSVSLELDPGMAVSELGDRVVELERRGVELLWVPEAYGLDAVSLLGYLAARTTTMGLASGILPLFTRTPALLAMTAAGLDYVSGGRFELGIGASGPQVVEGLHGVPYDRPLARTRETMTICRELWARERPLEHDGVAYRIPLPPDAGSGLAKALKLIATPLRKRIPIHVAALGPANVALAAELAEGWLPTFFLPERAEAVFGGSLRRGESRRSDDLGPLEITAGGIAFVGEENRARDVLERVARPFAALYFGGMGARSRNFYNALFARYGYEDEAARVQDLYLAGRRDEAAAAIPLDFLCRTNLCGTPDDVRARVAAYRGAGVTNLLAVVADGDLDSVSRLRDLVT